MRKLTHFDFTTLGGPGFFCMPPIWSQKERQTTTTTKLWGTFTAISDTVRCSRELFSGLHPARSSLAGFWAARWGGSVPVRSRPARLHLILAKQRVGTIPGLSHGNSYYIHTITTVIVIVLLINNNSRILFATCGRNSQLF